MKPAFTLTLRVAFAVLICCLPKVVCSAPAKTGAAQKKSGHTQSYLFVDWNDVEKGYVVPVFDASRLTDEAKKGFEQRKKDWNIDVRLGKHGTQQYHIAHGIHIAVEPATKSPRWLLPDQPWEEDISGGNVIVENGLYRCWYSVTFPQEKVGVVYAEEGRGMETNGSGTCYAESKDGIHWTKPSLKLLSFKGSKENNIVSGTWIDTPFLDKHGPADERYKGFTFDELPAEDVPKGAGTFGKYGLYGMVSPDGYHWSRLTKPLVRHFCDSWNIAGWDASLGKYVGYFRGHTGGRSITRSETTDYHQWPMPETVLSVGPEESPTSDYYSCGFTTYPGMPALRLMFPGIYHLDTSLIDVRLAVSRDGYGWNWVAPQAIIETGTGKDWDRGMLFAQPDLCRLGDGRLAICYSGYDHGHETEFAKSYRDMPKSESGLAWALWPDGRLAGIQADKEGEFYGANPVRDLASIEINVRTMAHGRVEVEFVDKDRVLPGYSFHDCVPITGDKLSEPVRFKGKNDFSDLRGQKFQVHFRLVHAKIFGYQTKNS